MDYLPEFNFITVVKVLNVVMALNDFLMTFHQKFSVDMGFMSYCLLMCVLMKDAFMFPRLCLVIY